MRVVLLMACLAASLPAPAIDERWHVDTASASRAIPLATDYDSDGDLDVVVTTRFDGALWVLDGNGRILHRVYRDEWLEGSVAATQPTGSTAAPLLAFQQSGGTINLLDSSEETSVSAPFPGEPRLGSFPCFSDLDMDGSSEIVVGRRNGTVTAVDLRLVPAWQFDAGAPIDASPAVAPIFENEAAIYAVSTDGRVHGVSGRGRPLWHFHMDNPSPRYPSVSDLLVVQLAYTHPSVVIGDRMGILYAIDSVTGELHWRTRPGRAPAGAPIIADVHPSTGAELVTVSEAGEIAVIDPTGSVLSRAALPAGRYVARPLLADVDGDEKPEIVVPVDQWEIVVAALDGTVKQRVPLRGNVLDGLALADLDGDGALELLAATDCARVYCFTTQARSGWMHPRGGGALTGCVLPIPSTRLPAPPETTRGAPPTAVVFPEFTEESPFGTAWVRFEENRKTAYASVAIRQDDRILGSSSKPLRSGGVTIPMVRYTSDTIALDIALYDRDGQLLAATNGYAVRPRVARPVALAAPEPFFAALDTRAAAFSLPAVWALPQVAARDSWHVVRFMPEAWSRYGIGDEAFIREAIPRVASSAKQGQLFAPGEPAWSVVQADAKPFFVMNDYFRPEEAYPKPAVAAIEAMAGDRFLGFPVHEWDQGVWKSKWEDNRRPPESPAEAMDLMRGEFEELMRLTHGRIYEGQGYGLFHHQAFEWGAPMGYAEVGENVPCAPLQYAFLRGASRQYGGRPWGAYVSNWFRGAVADTRFSAREPRVSWSKPNVATGPDCGHSSSLEFRLEMAAHLAGATFVHHESDGHNGSIFVEETAPNRYEMSEFGRAIQRWYSNSREHAERGVPYTPVAFMVDFNHGWRPREDRFGLWPRGRAEWGIENLFAHVFPYGGRLDFEKGYLANGPYGDIFDVVTNDASVEVLRSYGVVWPLGRVELTRKQAASIEEYVRAGGILIVDSANAGAFPADFLGARFKDRHVFGNGIQTALGSLPPIAAPYRYQPMWVLRDAKVLAHSDDGSPLAVWQRQGSGIVIVSGTNHWSDETDAILPLVPALLRPITAAFSPVQVEGDVEVLLNRTRDAWVIGLINNDGVRKVPTLPAEVVGTPKDCVLRFRGRSPLKFNGRMGAFTWNAKLNGLTVTLKPGDVAIVEARLGDNNPAESAL